MLGTFTWGVQRGPWGAGVVGSQLAPCVLDIFLWGFTSRAHSWGRRTGLLGQDVNFVSLHQLKTCLENEESPFSQGRQSWSTLGPDLL